QYHAKARYIAPVSTWTNPSAFATNLALVLLPLALVPSMAMTIGCCIYVRRNLVPSPQPSPHRMGERAHKSIIILQIVPPNLISVCSFRQEWSPLNRAGALTQVSGKNSETFSSRKTDF